MMYKGILEFRGTWRNYQKRVLDRSAAYLADRRIHIVAAPGSGKTTLGIELINRTGKPALILAPSITIREQWIERITSVFLQEGIKPEQYLSQNIKEPKAITAITYQALHSAVNHYTGKLKEENEEAEREENEEAEREENEEAEREVNLTEEEEEVDFSRFDLLETIKKAGIEVICLDECHHLRNEWWKALEGFIGKTGNKTIISLTATPPYDSTPALWARYLDLCGEIDEEITVPELVKEGSLCPHQDYVYFNYPTREEKQAAEDFRNKAEELFAQLMSDTEFSKVIGSHLGLQRVQESGEVLLDKPEYLSALLIFYKQKGLPFDSYLMKLLGAKALPNVTLKRMEILLQGFLYDDENSFCCDKIYREQLEHRCKRAGLINKRKVCLVLNDKIEKMLISSKGKIQSIKQIVKSEYEGMGSRLRLLVLTDYIKKEYIKSIGDLEKDTEALGVIPFFEMLRRENTEELKLGVLCGSVVIIPESAKEALEKTLGDKAAVTYTGLGTAQRVPYVVVNAIGDSHFLTAAMTKIFTEGYVQVLIGTKSLLGEGWDAPCINSLILASFVGSYMLSNQMRGRAIRVMKNEPEKVSSIWHLVCMKEDSQNSEDYLLLERRMENFLGLHYSQDTIESGMRRLDIIREPFTKSKIDAVNKEMLTISSGRSLIKERWEKALEIHEKMEVETEAEVKPKETGFVLILFNALAFSILNIVIFVIMLSVVIGLKNENELRIFPGIILFVLMAAVMFAVVKFGAKALSFATPLRRLSGIGKGVLQAMKESGLLSETRVGIDTQEAQGLLYAIALKGGSARDKELFARCMSEFFNPIDNQRYLLVNSRKRKSMGSYYCVPEAFAKKKEDVYVFAECLKPFIGYMEPVYTRTPEGRRLLLEGRIYAFANKQDRCVTRKKVKGALQ